jgi:transforming growth factor-beta-induced protein
VKINNAMVTRADIKSNNGIIHAIDQVILPPTENLVGLAQSLDPEFSLLIAAVTKANLGGVLSEGGVFTVFAPTNNAFLALLEELKLSSLDDIPMGLLTEVLLYHVVEGRVYSSDLENGSVTTLNGTFNINLNNLKITDSNNREASLIPSLLNVQATNGVVHVIDKVILP